MYPAQSVGMVTCLGTLDEVVRRAFFPTECLQGDRLGRHHIGCPRVPGWIRTRNSMYSTLQSSVVLATDEVVTRDFTVLYS